MMLKGTPVMTPLPRSACLAAPSGYGSSPALAPVLAVALTLALALSGAKGVQAQTPDLGALAAAIKANPEMAAGNLVTAPPGDATDRDPVVPDVLPVPDVTETDRTGTDMTETAPAGSGVVPPPGGADKAWNFPASADELAAEARAARERIGTVAVPDTRTVICSFLAGLATPEANQPEICNPPRQGG